MSKTYGGDVSEDEGPFADHLQKRDAEHRLPRMLPFATEEARPAEHDPP